MFSYTQAAMERMMKVQEVILRALAKKITWWQAAEIIGLSDRQMRRHPGLPRSPASNAGPSRIAICSSTNNHVHSYEEMKG